MNRSYTQPTTKSLPQPPIMLNPLISLRTLKKSSISPQQQLQQLLTCHICYCLAKTLTMCPYCSKIYCQQCIRKSLLIKPQCPHCRKYIKDTKSMADCQRFVNQMKEIIEQVLRQKDKQNFRCQEHDVALNYYCLECDRAVCCECKMFGIHKEHQLVQVEKKYKEKYEKVRAMLAQLKVCIREKEELVGKLEGNLVLARNQYQQELHQVHKLQQSFNDSYLKKISIQKLQTDTNISKLQQQLQKLSQSKKQLKQQYSKAKQQSRFLLNTEVKAKITHTIQQANTQAEFMTKQLNNQDSHISCFIPSYQCHTFVIEGFEIMQEKKLKEKHVIYSEPVKMLDCEWKLKIYPYGSDSVQGKFLSIYVMMVKSKDNNDKTNLSPSKSLTSAKKHNNNIYEYLIELVKPQEQCKQSDNNNLQATSLNQKWIKNFSRQYSSAFEPGESWGYNKYIELTELKKLGLVRDDRLVIKYGIRRPDYHAEYKSLLRQLEDVEQQIKDKEVITKQQEE